jgi:hypothetical protein
MEFKDEIATLSDRISSQSALLETEEATKFAFVVPFIRALGYDPNDPADVIPESTCDDAKPGEKVDIAIMKDGKPIMMFECKSMNSDLDQEKTKQLLRYFAVTDMKVGVLTNGTIYKFYSDLEKANRMDSRPFLEVDLRDLKEPILAELDRFRKETFEADVIVSAAHELKYKKAIKEILKDELKKPSEEFVRFFTGRKFSDGSKLYEGRLTQRLQPKFENITRRAFNEFINDEIDARYEKLKEIRKIEEGEAEIEAESEQPLEKKGIVTTEEEIEGYHIVRAILHEIVDPERVVFKDTVSYCNVLLDNNVRKPICRFFFDGKQKYVAIFGENKVQERVPIDKLSDIYKYTDKIKATVGYYDKTNSSKNSLTSPEM